MKTDPGILGIKVAAKLAVIASLVIAIKHDVLFLFLMVFLLNLGDLLERVAAVRSRPKDFKYYMERVTKNLDDIDNQC